MEQEYVSGMGKDSVVPEEIKGWSWGAFLLNWVWGIGNSTYIAFLMFVPLVNVVMIFVLGAKGNEWAWKNRTWRDIEHFRTTQKKWRNAGLILLFVVIPLLFVLIMNMMKGEAYELSVQAAVTNSEVLEAVGNAPETGFFVLGEISHGGSGGTANLNYTLEGDKGSVEVYVYATKLGDSWELKEVLAVDEATGKRLVVITQSK